ncbi:hypothetical protein HOLleu_17005 [Holothuria leucospilota]|uniref:Uncharacterized protein n=1 Tax=Holothuria leucospilota TaxID=206669 RepID=A0A9Q1H878_HOLLE|nr:hypothetical protein HOLleu_17005 [Holothuria leucospilota]
MNVFIEANTLDCPPKVYAEFMKDVIIDCKISDVGNVYWYKGNSTKTSPIVKLQDGRMYTFQGHGHYDINENGSLVVVDLEEEHFGVYSVVHFYSNSKSETDQIQLEIAVKPRVACPSINGCFNCSDECTLLVKTTDILTCSIIRALPAVDIKILVNSGSGIRVLRNASNKTFDPVTGTWNTTSVIEYEWHDCSLSTLITCATRDLQAFELSDRIVTIQSGNLLYESKM